MPRGSATPHLRDASVGIGVPHGFHPLDGAGHRPWTATIDGRPLSEVARAFVEAHLE